MRQGARCALAALLLACGGQGSTTAGAGSSSAPAPEAPSAAVRRAPSGARALGAPTAAASHQEFKAAGYECADCHPCGGITTGHGATWMDASSPAFHALAANRSLADCQTCHGPNLDGVGARTTIGCQSCHGQTWRTNCVMCHGGTDGQSGAPPRATFGNSADAVRVGAHTAHVAGSPTAQAFDCAVCHVVPAGALDPGHVGGATAAVTFGALAVQGGAAPQAWNRAAPTCAGTYCHGNFKNGNAQNAPDWTKVGQDQAKCGTCHGLPPASGHVARTDCGACHAGYTATTVNAATHVNGRVDAVAMTCTTCHGSAGRTATAASPRYAAPPLDTLGASTGLRVGAHQSHVAGKTFSSGIACQDCHPSVATYTTTHADGATNVAFTSGTSSRFNAGTYTPRSGSTAATCSNTYCHAVKSAGGTSSGGTLPAPSWSAAITACTACHRTAPSTGRHTMSEHRVTCSYCHGGTYTSAAADKTRHVNGVIEVNGPRIRSWNATTRTCSPTCHGSESWGR